MKKVLLISSVALSFILLSLAIIPLTLAEQISIEPMNVFIESGKNVTINIIDSNAIISRDAFFYKNETKLTSIDLCAEATCAASSIIYTIPQGWEGEYYLAYYDHTTTEWKKEYFTVVKVEAPVIECYTYIDCTEGKMCIDAKCELPEECYIDADCTGGKICTDGNCVVGVRACYIEEEEVQNKECSASYKPKYCDDGILADNCNLCGCSVGYDCNDTTGSCAKTAQPELEAYFVRLDSGNYTFCNYPTKLRCKSSVGYPEETVKKEADEWDRLGCADFPADGEFGKCQKEEGDIKRRTIFWTAFVHKTADEWDKLGCPTCEEGGFPGWSMRSCDGGKKRTSTCRRWFNQVTNTEEVWKSLSYPSVPTEGKFIEITDSKGNKYNVEYGGILAYGHRYTSSNGRKTRGTKFYTNWIDLPTKKDWETAGVKHGSKYAPPCPTGTEYLDFEKTGTNDKKRRSICKKEETKSSGAEWDCLGTGSSCPSGSEISECKETNAGSGSKTRQLICDAKVTKTLDLVEWEARACAPCPSGTEMARAGPLDPNCRLGDVFIWSRSPNNKSAKCITGYETKTKEEWGKLETLGVGGECPEGYTFERRQNIFAVKNDRRAICTKEFDQISMDTSCQKGQTGVTDISEEKVSKINSSGFWDTASDSEGQEYEISGWYDLSIGKPSCASGDTVIERDVIESPGVFGGILNGAGNVFFGAIDVAQGEKPQRYYKTKSFEEVTCRSSVGKASCVFGIQPDCSVDMPGSAQFTNPSQETARNENILNGIHTLNTPINEECSQVSENCGTYNGQHIFCNACSLERPKYCDNGNLIDKCSLCGCPEDSVCDIGTNSCILDPQILKDQQLLEDAVKKIGQAKS